MPDPKLNEIIDRILQVMTPEKIILFGSRARGDQKETSDYDLLVVKSSTESDWTIEKALYKNFIDLGVPVDVLLTTPEKLEKHKDTVGYVYKDALKYGKVVYGY